ncbi:hypothetical protein YC2023_067305 [Brassica napus]
MAEMKHGGDDVSKKAPFYMLHQPVKIDKYIRVPITIRSVFSDIVCFRALVQLRYYKFLEWEGVGLSYVRQRL